MSKFDKIIGYETVKNELIQVCDMIKNPDVYKKMGAKMPKGILLYGNPGIGKSLMAKCFIEECGIPAFTVRRNMGKDFSEYITKIFKEATEKSPSIIFLDDMDKFANEDKNHCDAEEYVAVQAGIDEAKDRNVFVFATANDIDKLPDSLIRSGRFDRKIELHSPNGDDCKKIIEYYLADKTISEDVNIDDLSKMICYSSCAELESILNEASINAAFERKDAVCMKDIVKAVLKLEYNSPDSYTKPSEDELKKVALHEAGHLVVCEVLCNGSVGIASLRTDGINDVNGFIRRCKRLPDNRSHVLVSLAGKAAEELVYGRCATGSDNDLDTAVEALKREISYSGTSGIGMLDASGYFHRSEDYLAKSEAVVIAELEKCLFAVRQILLNNNVFLEKATEALLNKETLLFSDIKEIRESLTA